MKKLFTVILLLLFFKCISAQDTEQNINVIFNDSAAQYVLKDLPRAQQERDFIWNNFDGYRITLVWHKESSFPITWNYWEKCLNRFINKDTSLKRKTLELSNNLMSLEKKEHSKIVRHISTFLPKNISYITYVYLVAFTIPYAFCVEQNKIGIDISADEWYFSPEFLLNMTIHEIYHAGYHTFTADKKYLDKDPTDRETFIRSCYATILNEGMATYVAYRALDLFPTEYKQDDYKMLEDDNKVKTAIGQVNELLDNSDKLAIDSLNKLAWDFGVSKRAFYVTGAFIAKTIEEKFGRDYMVKLIQKGGYEFVKDFNVIVPKEYKIALQ